MSSTIGYYCEGITPTRRAKPDVDVNLNRKILFRRCIVTVLCRVDWEYCFNGVIQSRCACNAPPSDCNWCSGQQVRSRIIDALGLA